MSGKKKIPVEPHEIPERVPPKTRIITRFLISRFNRENTKIQLNFTSWDIFINNVSKNQFIYEPIFIYFLYFYYESFIIKSETIGALENHKKQILTHFINIYETNVRIDLLRFTTPLLTFRNIAYFVSNIKSYEVIWSKIFGIDVPDNKTDDEDIDVNGIKQALIEGYSKYYITMDISTQELIHINLQNLIVIWSNLKYSINSKIKVTISQSTWINDEGVVKVGNKNNEYWKYDLLDTYGKGLKFMENEKDTKILGIMMNNMIIFISIVCSGLFDDHYVRYAHRYLLNYPPIFFKLLKLLKENSMINGIYTDFQKKEKWKKTYNENSTKWFINVLKKVMKNHMKTHIEFLNNYLLASLFDYFKVNNLTYIQTALLRTPMHKFFFLELKEFFVRAENYFDKYGKDIKNQFITYLNSMDSDKFTNNFQIQRCFYLFFRLLTSGEHDYRKLDIGVKHTIFKHGTYIKKNETGLAILNEAIDNVINYLEYNNKTDNKSITLVLAEMINVLYLNRYYNWKNNIVEELDIYGLIFNFFGNKINMEVIKEIAYLEKPSFNVFEYQYADISITANVSKQIELLKDINQQFQLFDIYIYGGRKTVRNRELKYEFSFDTNEKHNSIYIIEGETACPLVAIVYESYYYDFGFNDELNTSQLTNFVISKLERKSINISSVPTKIHSRREDMNVNTAINYIFFMTHNVCSGIINLRKIEDIMVHPYFKDVKNKVLFNMLHV